MVRAWQPAGGNLPNRGVRAAGTLPARARAWLAGVMTVTDRARFLVEDPVELVAASFMCPLCLAGVEGAVVELGAEDSLARCSCPACDHEWEVALHAGQVLRLTLAPPAELRLRFARAGGGIWPSPPA
jgi:hypothetical protein